jgi:hypothetical protein
MEELVMKLVSTDITHLVRPCIKLGILLLIILAPTLIVGALFRK